MNPAAITLKRKCLSFFSQQFSQLIFSLNPHWSVRQGSLATPRITASGRPALEGVWGYRYAYPDLGEEFATEWKETCSGSENRSGLGVVSTALGSMDVTFSQDTSGQSQCPLWNVRPPSWALKEEGKIRTPALWAPCTVESVCRCVLTQHSAQSLQRGTHRRMFPWSRSG